MHPEAGIAVTGALLSALGVFLAILQLYRCGGSDRPSPESSSSETGLRVPLRRGDHAEMRIYIQPDEDEDGEEDEDGDRPSDPPGAASAREAEEDGTET